MPQAENVPEKDTSTERQPASVKDTVGDDTNNDRPPESSKDGASTADTNDNPPPNTNNDNYNTSDGHKANDYNGGEVVMEDQEDTVIY